MPYIQNDTVMVYNLTFLVYTVFKETTPAFHRFQARSNSRLTWMDLCLSGEQRIVTSVPWCLLVFECQDCALTLERKMAGPRNPF